MRILYVIDSMKVGGAEQLLVEMVKTYTHAGNEIVVSYFSPGPLDQRFAQLGVRVERIGRRGLADPFALPRLLRLILSLRPDVVHTHLVKSDLVGQLAAAIARVPVRVSSAHNVDPWRRRGVLTVLNRMATCCCQRVIAVSREVHDYLISVGAYPGERIITIENGIDLEHFDPRRHQPPNLTSRWGLGIDDPAIGVVGRLVPQKGHAILLEAAVRVMKQVPRARLVIIGDGPLRAALALQCDRLGLGDRVVFTGIVRDIPAALAALDVVTFPSLWEGLPVALLEAMAMEKPIVATAVGGIPGVLRNGHSGVLVAAGDPSDLSRGLLQVLGDPLMARHLGEQARRVVQERYSAETMHRRILAVYEGCFG